MVIHYFVEERILALFKLGALRLYLLLRQVKLLLLNELLLLLSVHFGLVLKDVLALFAADIVLAAMALA